MIKFGLHNVKIKLNIRVNNSRFKIRIDVEGRNITSCFPDSHIVRCRERSHRFGTTVAVEELRSPFRVTGEDCHGCGIIFDHFMIGNIGVQCITLLWWSEDTGCYRKWQRRLVSIYLITIL